MYEFSKAGIPKKNVAVGDVMPMQYLTVTVLNLFYYLLIIWSQTYEIFL